MAVSSLGPALRAAVDDELVETVVAAIAEGVPRYALALSGSFGRGVRSGVRHALGHLVDRLDAPAHGERPELAISAALGRGEAHRDRSLPDLLAAYRVGTRVAWRRFAAVCAQVEPARVAELAELLFAYVDELSAAAADGYSAERERRAGALSSRRRNLARALLSGAPAAERAMVATAAAWPLPPRIAVVVAEPAAPLAIRLGEAALVLDEPDGTLALLAVPDGAATRPASLADLPVAVGPPVTPDLVPQSRRLAERLRALHPEQATAAYVEDHLLDLLLRAEPVLLDALGERHLRPLDAAPSRSAAWLRPTLLEWLRSDGSRTATAEALHVHPQTVRYRVERLRELLGPALVDPLARREMEVALRCGR